MRYIIKEGIEISDTEQVMNSISYLLERDNKKVDLTIEDIGHFIKTQKSTEFYISADLAGVSENERNKADYLWLDTGLLYKEQFPIFLSLYNNKNGVFEGFYTGTASRIANSLIRQKPWLESGINHNCKRFMEKYAWKTEGRDVPNLMDKVSDNKIAETQDIEKIKAEKEYESTPTAITEYVRNQLMVYNWNAESGLDRYLKVIGSRIPSLIKDNKEDYM